MPFPAAISVQAARSAGVTWTTAPVLTQEMLDEAMARAEKAACAPGDDRCYPLADPLHEAQQTCTPKGRCKIGWIVRASGRESFDVWLDVHTGEGQLRKQADSR